MTYSAHIYNAGTIQVNTSQQIHKGFDISGALAAYSFSTLEELVKKVNKCDYVQRPDGRIEKGKDYTAKKAAFDYKGGAIY